MRLKRKTKEVVTEKVRLVNWVDFPTYMAVLMFPACGPHPHPTSATLNLLIKRNF